MSKRTLVAETVRAERVNCKELLELERDLAVYMATDVTAAKADTAIPVGALYVSLDDMIVRYKNEQT